MKTATVGLSVTLLLSWTFSSPTFAQQGLPPGQAFVEDSAAEEGVSDLNTRSIFDNSNYMIRSDFGDSVGYIRGFQTLAAFQPINVIPDELIFWMSPRGFITYNSANFGANLGAGARYLNPENQRILGGGAWWDHDNNGTNIYNQFGVSSESLGNYLDFRINTYYPTNQRVHLVSQSFTPSSTPYFLGNNIAIGQNNFLFNNALKGGDFETGGALPGIGDVGVRAYAGGYYYQGPISGGGVYGFRGRLEALITQNLWGTVILTHDRLFGTNVTAAATLYLGSGESPRLFGRIPMQTRLYQQMERQYRVTVQRDVEHDLALALRAGGTGGSGGPLGTPIVVDHVDNTAPAGGDGSVLHPFNHLPTTTPGNVDIIFVNRGDGTSKFMDQGITLNNFQRLLGDGVQHQVVTTQGTFNLPGFTAGALPTITNVNPNGTAVTLASNNEVSGFNITAASGYGIANFNPTTTLFNPITNFNINNVILTAAGSGGGPNMDGVHLENATGIGLISSSSFDNNAGNGVIINNNVEGSKLALAVGGSSANNVTANGNAGAGITLVASDSEIDPTFTNVTANNNQGDGIQISLNRVDPASTGSSMTGVFTNVTASNNNNPFVSAIIGSGFDYQSLGSTGKITMTNSTFNSNGLNGINISLDQDGSIAPRPSTFTGTFDQIIGNSNNNPVVAAVAANGFGNGFGYFSDHGSTGTVTITRSIFDTNGLNGISFTTNGGSTLTTSLINNNTTISGNLQDGILFTNADSTVNATLLNNRIINNDGRGIDIVSTANTLATRFNMTLGGYLTQDTNGNGVLDAGEDNVVIPSLNFPAQTPNVIVGNGFIDREGNTITGNHQEGVLLTTNGAASGVANTVLFIARGNILTGNTTVSTPTANMMLNVGTGPLVYADVQKNTFGGNATDFATQSFFSPGLTTANLNVRFTGNTGTAVVPAGGGIINNAVFQVEDTYVGGTGSALNDFNTFTGTPNVQGAFTAGGFVLVPVGTFTPPMPPLSLP